MDNSNENVIINVNNIIKIYRLNDIETVALNKFSFKFLEGKIYVIMGPSGCGKSTLLNLISHLDNLSAGSIYFKDENMSLFSEERSLKYRKEQISYVFQFYNLIPFLTVIENILFRVDNKEEYYKRVNELLINIGIKEKSNSYPDMLSGGEQQRVAIASALIPLPELVICDEPTGELDSKSKMSILNLFNEIHKKHPKITFIIASHDKEISTIADEILYMRDGTISSVEIQGDKDKQFHRINMENEARKSKQIKERIDDSLFMIEKLKSNLENLREEE